MIQRFTYLGWQDTIVSGWGSGSYDYDYDLSNILPTLNWVQVTPVSDETCGDALTVVPLPEDLICAGARSAEGSVCLYDDGGPLVTRASGDSGYSLIGVVAFWDCIEVLAVPGLYNEVSHFLSWIAEEYGLSLP